MFSIQWSSVDPVANIPYKLVGHAPAISIRYSRFQKMRTLTKRDGYPPEVCVHMYYKVPWSCWHELFHSRHLSILMPILYQPGPSHLQILTTQYFGHHLRSHAPTYLWAHNILSISLASFFCFVWSPSSTPPPFIPTWLISSTTPSLASRLCWYSQNARLLVIFLARNLPCRSLFLLTMRMPWGVVTRLAFFFALGEETMAQG